MPSIESYFNRWASVLVSVRSLAATNSIRVVQTRADDISANTAKAVDTYLNGHNYILCRGLFDLLD